MTYRVISAFKIPRSMRRRAINIYPVQFYASDFGHMLEQPEHASARAIRIHDRRKTEPGYSNRGTRAAFRRWFNAALEKVYQKAGVIHD